MTTISRIFPRFVIGSAAIEILRNTLTVGRRYDSHATFLKRHVGAGRARRSGEDRSTAAEIKKREGNAEELHALDR